MESEWPSTSVLVISAAPLLQTSIARVILRDSLLDVRLRISLIILSHLIFLSLDGCELMFVGIGFVVVPIIVLSYIRINKQRDETTQAALESGEKNKYTNQQLREMGDKAPDFRYTL